MPEITLRARLRVELLVIRLFFWWCSLVIRRRAAIPLALLRIVALGVPLWRSLKVRMVAHDGAPAILVRQLETAYFEDVNSGPRVDFDFREALGMFSNLSVLHPFPPG